MPNHGAFSSARPGFAVRSLKKIGQRGLLSPYGSLGLASSDFLMIDSLSLATESSTDAFPVIGSQEVADFSPVLNVPALASFLVVTAIFLFLQFRVASIGRAAEERTEALGALRSLKAKELTGEASPAEVNLALAKYRETYDRVEELRTVVPGARIVPPPSQSLSRERMDDNTAAARQFLGIESEAPVGKDDDTERSLPLPLALLLAVVAASQIGVLVLLSVDPMAHTGIF